MGIDDSGFSRDKAFWSIRCDDGREFAVQVNPDGTSGVLECADLKLLKAGACFQKLKGSFRVCSAKRFKVRALREPKKQRERPRDGEHRLVVKATDDRADAVPPHGHGLVDLELRRLAQAILWRRLHGRSDQGRVD
jgi:hypothetical protein